MIVCLVFEVTEINHSALGSEILPRCTPPRNSVTCLFSRKPTRPTARNSCIRFSQISLCTSSQTRTQRSPGPAVTMQTREQRNSLRLWRRFSSTFLRFSLTAAVQWAMISPLLTVRQRQPPLGAINPGHLWAALCSGRAVPKASQRPRRYIPGQNHPRRPAINPRPSSAVPSALVLRSPGIPPQVLSGNSVAFLPVSSWVLGNL